ncbi:MAG: phospholipid carrier-dependent glycosyltransferase [Verrucomicrobiota bacterium]
MPATAPNPFWTRLESPRASALVFLALALGLLLPGISSLPLMDRDEPRFAQATHEMRERGEWIVPYFNGDYRFDKPVGSYWLMRVHYWIFGKSEIGARLHSVWSAWLVAVTLGALGRFLFSARAGFLAGLAWLTSAQVLIHGRLCVADMPMILGTVLSFYALARLLFAQEEPPRFNRWFWLLVGSQAFAFLVKGPIPLVVLVLGLLLYRWPLGRVAVPWGRLQPLSFLVFYLLGLGTWGIPALWQTEGAFWEGGMGEHVIERGLQSFNGRLFLPVLPYLLFALISLFPWMAFLLTLTRERCRKLGPKGAFLLAWFLAPYLVFALYRTQLPHYVLPGFGGFFLLLLAEGRLPQLASPAQRRWFWLPFGLFAGAALFLFLLAVAAPLPEGLSGLRNLFGLAGLLIAGLVLGLGFLRKQALGLFLGANLVSALVVEGLGRQVRALHPALAIQELAKDLPTGTEFRACRFTEPSLVFYSQGAWEMRDDEAATAAWLAPGKNRLAVFLLREWTTEQVFDAFPDFKNIEVEREYEDLLRPLLPTEGYRYQIVTGFNAARTAWVEVLVALPSFESKTLKPET